MTEDTPCRFAVKSAFVEHGAPCEPLCCAYHIGHKCKGPVRRPRMPRPRRLDVPPPSPPTTQRCIRIQGKDEDPS